MSLVPLQVALTMTALALGLAVLLRVTRSAGPPRHRADTPPPGVASLRPHTCSTGGGVLPDRCEVCGWPLAASLEDGCVPGNCRTPDYRKMAWRTPILGAGR